MMTITKPFFTDIHYDDLRVWEDNPRGDTGDLEGLIASLEAMGGSMTPLIVYPSGKHENQPDSLPFYTIFTAIDGNRRLRGLTALLDDNDNALPLHPGGMVHCLVVPEATTNVALRYQIAAASDATKVGWLPSMTVQAYTDMHDAGASLDVIAATTGTSPKEVSQALLVGATVHQHVEMCMAVDNGQMPYEAAVIVALYTARLLGYPGPIFAATLDNLWMSWTQQPAKDMTEWAKRVATISGVHDPVQNGEPVERVKRPRTRYQLPRHMHKHAARLYEALDGGLILLGDADRQLLCLALAPYYQQYGAALAVSA